MEQVLKQVNKKGRLLNIVHCGLGLMGGIYTSIIRAHPLAQQYAVFESKSQRFEACVKSGMIPHFDQPLFLEPKDSASFLESHKDKIDGFLISSPSDTHVDYVKQFAPLGKPIYTEKPLGLDRKSCQEAFNECKKYNTPLIVGMTRRYERGFQGIKQKLDQGLIGKIQSVSTMLGDYPGPPLEFLKNCGGIIADLAIHDIDYILHIKGELPKRVYCITSQQIEVYKEAGVDDYCVVQFEFEDGSVSMHEMRRYAPGGYDIRVQVLGSKGNAKLENIPQTKVLFSDETGNLREDGYPSFPIRFWDAYSAEVQELLEIISDPSKQPRVSETEVINGMKMVQAAEISAKEKRVVDFSEIV